MTGTIITPTQESINLSVPREYIGKKIKVMFFALDESEDNAINETKYLMSSPEMMNWLRKAEESMIAGKGIKIDIDAL